VTESDRTPNDWIVCPACGETEDTYIIHWGYDNEVTIKCEACGEREDADWWDGINEEVTIP